MIINELAEAGIVKFEKYCAHGYELLASVVDEEFCIVLSKQSLYQLANEIKQIADGLEDI